MTSINIKVIGLTRTGFKAAGSRFEPTRFRFPDLPAQEASALLIQPGNPTNPPTQPTNFSELAQNSKIWFSGVWTPLSVSGSLRKHQPASQLDAAGSRRPSTRLWIEFTLCTYLHKVCCYHAGENDIKRMMAGCGVAGEKSMSVCPPWIGSRPT